MAEIEEAENGVTGLAREWLARAVHAPRDPAWVADNTSFPNWAPFAPESGRIGVFVWEHPPEWVETLSGAAKALQRIEAPPTPPVRDPAPATPLALPLETKPAEAGSAGGGEEEHAQGSVADEGARPANRSDHQAVPGTPSDIVMEHGEPAAPPSRVAEAPARKNDAGSSEMGAGSAPSASRIEPVAFPLERAPDDPGAQASDGKGLWRRLTE
jgi:HemY protein